MLTMDDLDPLLDSRTAVLTHQGEGMGPIGEVYLDETAEQPVWVTVRTGPSGTPNFVPLRGATAEGDHLVVVPPRALIEQAPSIDGDGHLGAEEEAALEAHYGLAGGAGAGGPDGAVRDDDGAPWMIRSEERLRVRTERHDAGRVRLRKYVVTEEARATVSLRREQLRVEVEPITSAHPDLDEDALFQERSVDVVLREEVAVVGVETVPVERVRMDTVTVAGRATVREEVRKERISTSVDGEPAPGAVSGKARRTTGKASRRRTEGENSSDIVRNRPNALLKGKKRR
ncbi:YsnF/AvaK domain-containing protein [Arthrobacter sp. RIT-PI-e]|uniref:YsnF/AvaK domain-containing protein n=1 Tax=Arthrobacter sp. RIT-PI-e TaxID=1681197 RepID=UPI0006762233|nr:YsnF/AvaK domain-containing protein [Arthrobacter sp. RIT-PI-e]